jgi:hypothetical protein
MIFYHSSEITELKKARFFLGLPFMPVQHAEPEKWIG